MSKSAIKIFLTELILRISNLLNQQKLMVPKME
jgi:hypothetical protein